MLCRIKDINGKFQENRPLQDHWHKAVELWREGDQNARPLSIGLE